MTANYHSHTYRCKHAVGSEREYVENAIKAGIKILGFSDHSPYIFTNGYVSCFRMLPSETEGYFRTITDLRDEYRDEIEIHVGVEAEYYPSFFEGTIRFLENFPCEYIILGQHILSDENAPDAFTSAWPTDDPHILRRYVDQVIAGIRTGKFVYLAHPDLLAFTGDEKIYRAYYRELCEEAKKAGLPLELNLLGVRDNRRYPDEKFWRIAAETGNEVILGTDAHDPGSFLDKESVEKALGMLKRNGITPIEKLALAGNRN